VTDALDGPLLGDRIAEENEKEVEDDGPEYNDCTNAIDPDSQLECEDAHVQGELAHLKGRKTPDVDQRESKSHLHDNRQVVDNYQR